MAYKVNSLEEMPNALSYLIESVEVLQSKVNALQHKQASSSPKWMDIDELCAYLPSHPAKQTVYGWVSTKQIPVHKINKALAFLQSEIDDWLKNKSHKTQDDLMEEARRFVESKKRLLLFVLSQAHSKHRTDKGGRYCGCVSLYHRALCATTNRVSAFDAIFSRIQKIQSHPFRLLYFFGIIP